jgi:hypothetical protein
MTSCCSNTECGNTTKIIYGAAFGSREANFQIDKEEISTNTARKDFYLNVLMKEKRKDFQQERINQLSTAEFRETKVRHKLGTVYRIRRRWSDIVSNLNQLLLVY